MSDSPLLEHDDPVDTKGDPDRPADDIKLPDLDKLGLGGRNLFAEALNVQVRQKVDKNRTIIGAASHAICELHEKLTTALSEGKGLDDEEVRKNLLDLLAMVHNEAGMAADAAHSLEDASRRTMVQAHGDYTRHNLKENAKLLTEMRGRQDSFTISLSRMHDRMSKYQSKLDALTNVVRALIYLECERGRFMSPKEIASFDGSCDTERFFQDNFSNFQIEMNRIYPERLGRERDPGLAGEMLLVGQAYTKVFNLKKCESLNRSSSFPSPSTSSTPE